jgi:hypothetical protein
VGLLWRNIPAIDILIDLVDFGLASVCHSRVHVDCGAVVAFVDILEDILDGGDSCADLDVDVYIILCHQIKVLRHNPRVII